MYIKLIVITFPESILIIVVVVRTLRAVRVVTLIFIITLVAIAQWTFTAIILDIATAGAHDYLLSL